MPHPAVPQTPRLIQFTRDHPLPLSHERRAFTRMAKRGPVDGREVPIVSAAIPRAQTQIIRWSATIEANGAAIVRVDHEGISIISNFQDYAGVLRSSASHLLSIVDAEGSTRANASHHEAARVPAAWKTTEPSVCVRLTDDPGLANHWRASGFHVVELFD